MSACKLGFRGVIPGVSAKAMQQHRKHPMSAESAAPQQDADSAMEDARLQFLLGDESAVLMSAAAQHNAGSALGVRTTQCRSGHAALMSAAAQRNQCRCMHMNHGAQSCVSYIMDAISSDSEG